MIIRSDNHTHVIFEPPERMVESARRRGFETVSITEHISQIQEVRASVKFGSTHSSGKLFDSLESYFRELDSLRRGSSPIKIKMGLEVDYIPAYEDEITRIIAAARARKPDIVLRSVHELADRKDIEEKYPNRSSSDTWDEYIETQIELVRRSRIRFDVLTHPVRLGKGTPTYPERMLESLTHLAEACAQRGVRLELNGKDLSEREGLVKMLARACATANCGVSFGSDAHYSREVGRGRELAEVLVEEFHLDAEEPGSNPR